ncbi:MAG: hypothetical protein ACR2LU_04990, partial [Luteitalea sp.]
MGPWTFLTVLALVVDGVLAAAILLWWLTARKRLAAEAAAVREQAALVLRNAERDALARQKEAEVAGRERAHTVLIDDEANAREVRGAAHRAELEAAD